MEESIQILVVVSGSLVVFVFLYAGWVWVLAKISKVPFKEALKWKR